MPYPFQKSFRSAEPTRKAVQVLATNPKRVKAWIYNNSYEDIVYLGGDPSVTAATGYPLPPGTSLLDDQTTSAWWAVVPEGTGDVRALEIHS
jgi:hypothetical protein